MLRSKRPRFWDLGTDSLTKCAPQRSRRDTNFTSESSRQILCENGFEAGQDQQSSRWLLDATQSSFLRNIEKTDIEQFLLMNTKGCEISDDIVWNSAPNLYITTGTYTEIGNKRDVTNTEQKIQENQLASSWPLISIPRISSVQYTGRLGKDSANAKDCPFVDWNSNWHKNMRSS